MGFRSGLGFRCAWIGHETATASRLEKILIRISSGGVCSLCPAIFRGMVKVRRENSRCISVMQRPAQTLSAVGAEELSPARIRTGVPDSRRLCANWGGMAECWVTAKYPSPVGVCVIAQVENETVGSIAPGERKNQPRSGEMVLGGGVSPRSSGKRNEPQSGDTSYGTDTVGTTELLSQPQSLSKLPAFKSYHPNITEVWKS